MAESAAGSPRDGKVLIKRRGSVVWIGIGCRDEYAAMTFYDQTVSRLDGGIFVLSLAADGPGTDDDG